MRVYFIWNGVCDGKEKPRQLYCSVRDRRNPLTPFHSPAAEFKETLLREENIAAIFTAAKTNCSVHPCAAEALQGAEWRDLLSPSLIMDVTAVITATGAAEVTALKCWGPPTRLAAQPRVHIFATTCASRRQQARWEKTSAPVTRTLLNTDVLPVWRYVTPEEGQKYFKNNNSTCAGVLKSWPLL